MRFFGYPYNDLVICKDSPDYLLLRSRSSLCLKLQTEQFVMSQIDFGRELNKRIALHRKLLYASVPCLPVLTWEMTHDLPLRSEKLHKFGFERFCALFSIIFQIKIIQYLSLRLWRE